MPDNYQLIEHLGRLRETHMIFILLLSVFLRPYRNIPQFNLYLPHSGYEARGAVHRGPEARLPPVDLSPPLEIVDLGARLGLVEIA